MANNGEAQRDIDALRQDMATLRHDLSSVLDHVIDDSKEKSRELRDKAKDAGKRAMDATESQIKERPFLSVLMVFVIGMILGKMLDQRLRS